MDVGLLKEYIIDNNCIEQILQELKCHHIKYHSSGYYTCANPDGNNPSAIVVYCDNLLCSNYTRQISKKKKNDLIDLAIHLLQASFPDTLKFLCSVLGIDYYYDFTEDIPESLLLTDLLFNMSESMLENTDKPIKPIDKKILSYYKPYVNDMFAADHIDYRTQREFEIGYDPYTNRITIPIYSEIGDLVGVKGRLFKEELEEGELKYLYLEPTSRARILYGLNKTLPYIKEAGCVYVVEAEKGVMQGFAYGTKNIVGTGGKELSTTQIEMLTRLGVDIIFAFDRDVTEEEIEELADRFLEGVPIYYIYDKENKLKEKESPTDNPDTWEYLKEHNKYRMR